MRVRETIHHGNHRSVREQTIDPTWTGFVNLLTSSPYGAGESPESLAKNKYAAKTFADLLTAGIAERGWARYEVLT